MALMLATELKSLEDISKSRTYIIQQKLDGARYQLFLSRDGRVELRGRHSNQINNYLYPEIIEEAQIISRGGLAEDITLDGEVIVGSKNGVFYMNNFSQLQSREHTQHRLKINLLRKHTPARFVVFDIIAESTKGMTLRERTETLQIFLSRFRKENDPIYTTNRIAPIPSHEGTYDLALKLFEDVRKLELEGLVLKDPESKYEDRRSDAWLKLRVWKETEMKVIGYTSKNREISSLILEDSSRVNALVDEYWAERILKQDVGIRQRDSEQEFIYFRKPSFSAKVKYMEGTDKLRFPVLKEMLNM